MNNTKGFTLIELILVMVIIAGLAAISIPHYYEYKTKAYDAEAISGLKSAAIAQEGYFTASAAYTMDPSQLEYYGARYSHSIIITIVSADEDSYVMEGSHIDSPNSYIVSKGTAVIKQ